MKMGCIQTWMYKPQANVLGFPTLAVYAAARAWHGIINEKQNHTHACGLSVDTPLFPRASECPPPHVENSSCALVCEAYFNFRFSHVKTTTVRYLYKLIILLLLPPHSENFTVAKARPALRTRAQAHPFRSFLPNGRSTQRQLPQAPRQAQAESGRFEDVPEPKRFVGTGTHNRRPVRTHVHV
jgi:hypothetical protein